MLANLGFPVASGRESGGVVLTAEQAHRASPPAPTSSRASNRRRAPLPALEQLRVRLRMVSVCIIGNLVEKAGGRNMNGRTPLAAFRKV